GEDRALGVAQEVHVGDVGEGHGRFEDDGVRARFAVDAGEVDLRGILADEQALQGAAGLEEDGVELPFLVGARRRAPEQDQDQPDPSTPDGRPQGSPHVVVLATANPRLSQPGLTITRPAGFANDLGLHFFNWLVIDGSVIFASAASRNALLRTIDSVASPSKGRKTRSPPATVCFGTMHRYWSLGAIRTLPLPRWILYVRRSPRTTRKRSESVQRSAIFSLGTSRSSRAWRVRAAAESSPKE